MDILLGFPAGFSLLALAFVVLDIAYVIPLANNWNWASLLLTSWGFVFLAVTYYIRYEKRNIVKASSAFTVLGILTVTSVLLILFAPLSLLPPYLPAELGFRAINIVVLGYIIFNLNRALKTETRLSSVVLGFTFLTIDQYSLLLNVFDRSFVWSVIFAQLVRIAGLFILTIFLVQGFQGTGRRVS